MTLMLSALGLHVAPRLAIDTDILALLPRAHDAAVDNAIERLAAKMAQRQLFLIGAGDPSRAKDAARRFASELSASGQFASVVAEIGGNLNAASDAYRTHWPYLLADADRERLTSGQRDALYRDALRAAYTPAGMMRLLPLGQDPLGLAGNFLRQQMPVLGNAELDGGMLIASAGERHYVLVTAETKASVFAASAIETLMPAIARATQAARQSGAIDSASADAIEVLSSGALQHAAAATAQAQQEIATFGTVETVAVLALLFFAFGRLRPLVLGAMVLGLSAAAAITVSHFVFGKLHILALVFGASLIGVVIDYSMHFFTDQFRDQANWTPASGVAHVGPAILLGVFTTLVGYTGLVIMPFPGLRQIAAFCIVGIVVGCASVLCLYPCLLGSRRKPLPMRAPRLAERFDGFLRNWQWTRGKVVVLGAAAVLVAIGAARLQVQDDIHALQSSPPDILQNERRVQEILGGGVETRFFLIEGGDAETVLQREERLRAALDRAVADGKLGAYLAVSRALPSAQRQQADHELLKREVYGESGVYARLLTQMGFTSEQIAERARDAVEKASALSPDEWLASPASAAYRDLWLGQVGANYASIVTLSGIRDIPLLHSAAGAAPGVRFVDRPADVSAVLRKYRQVTTWLLVFANAVAFVVLSVRFGWRDGVRLVAPTVAACLTTLAVFGWFDVPFNLFNVFALLLVLALGIDYGIFLRHGQTSRVTAVLSVTLSACTTFIGFGMLAFSATPFIRSIGITLLFGILCSWAFAMLSCMTRWRIGAGDAAKVDP